MKVLGIVAEYNPFHNGHLHHLQKAVQIVQPDFTIAVMSGNFTQRGEPAIIDKWARAQMALENGIDLVLELPTLYACQTAELFALGAVGILHNTGLVTHMAFGSEYSDLQDLDEIAKILFQEPIEYRILLKEYLDKGLSFPFARLNAMKKYIYDVTKNTNLSPKLIDTILGGSNSILALEYLKALRKLKSPIQPIAIPRIGSSYNTADIEGQFSSATAIRRVILSGKNWSPIIPAIPDISLKILRTSMTKGRGPVSIESFEQLILGLLRRSSPEEISNWMDVGEGLENRIKRNARECTNIKEFLLKTKTKRYTYTRLQRILIHGLLGIETTDLTNLQYTSVPGYIRILGFKTKAFPLLKRLKTRSNLPIITKPAHYYRYKDDKIINIFEFDILATDLYALAFPNPHEQRGGQEITQSVVMI